MNVLLALNATPAQVDRVRAVEPARLEVRLLDREARRLLRGKALSTGQSVRGAGEGWVLGPADGPVEGRFVLSGAEGPSRAGGPDSTDPPVLAGTDAHPDAFVLSRVEGPPRAEGPDPIERPDPATAARLRDALAWADVMVADQACVRAWIPEQFPNLRWIQVTNAGVDYLVRRGLHKLPITITNARGMHDANMAEYVMLMCLAFTKGLVPHYLQAKRAHRWSEAQPDELAGKTLGVVGFGAIGRGVAKAAKAFGMRVVATRRRATGEPEPGADVMYPPARLHALLADSDFVLLATPWTPETDRLIGEPELAAMRPSAVLINIGRGTVVDEPALVRALQSGAIRGAALDVFAEEPLPPESPLWDLPNVVVTPHTSGNTPKYYDGVLDIFTASLRSVLAGGEPANIVDRDAGY